VPVRPADNFIELLKTITYYMNRLAFT